MVEPQPPGLKGSVLTYDALLCSTGITSTRRQAPFKADVLDASQFALLPRDS